MNIRPPRISTPKAKRVRAPIRVNKAVQETKKSVIPLFDHCIVVRLLEGIPQISLHFSVPGTPELPKNLSQFCFPDAENGIAAGVARNFAFTLTRDTGERIYGFCRRHVPPSSAIPISVKSSDISPAECICVLSRHSMFNLIKSLLECLQIRWLLQPKAMIPLIRTILAHPLPLPGEMFTVHLADSEALTFERSDDERTSSVDLNPLFSLLSPNHILSLVLALILECRIVVTHRSLSVISSVCHGALALLNPFNWHQIFVPVLPTKLLTYVAAPMPFFLGIPTASLPEVNKLPISPTLCVDLCHDKLYTLGADEGTVSSLIKHDWPDFCRQSLSRATATACSRAKSHTHLSGLDQRNVCDAYLNAMIAIFGHWRSCVDDNNHLDMDKVVEAAKPGSENLLKSVRHSQCFEVWSTERENDLRAPRNTLSRFATMTIDGNHLNVNNTTGLITSGSPVKTVSRAAGIVRNVALNVARDLTRGAREVTREAVSRVQSRVQPILGRTIHSNTPIILSNKHCDPDTALSLVRALTTGNKNISMNASDDYDEKDDYKDDATEIEDPSLQGEWAKVAIYLARSSFDLRIAHIITDVILDRLETGDGRHWRRIFRGLLLLSFLLKMGSDPIVSWTLTNSHIISALAISYSHNNAITRDVVRKKAIIVRDLIRNFKVLSTARLGLYHSTESFQQFLSDYDDNSTRPITIPAFSSLHTKFKPSSITITSFQNSFDSISLTQTSQSLPQHSKITQTYDPFKF